ncbi:MAG: site-specific DNA-methyltransferase [Rhodocyclaceae bacterium]|nr:MAG: site-specific DNA-methyltransferase [Rhodocyclaceae bacterium]
MPPQSVDLILTDVPYSSGGAFRGDRAAGTGSKYCDARFDGAAALPDFTGDNRDQRGFLTWCALVLGQCHRVAKPGAIFATFIDWRQLPTMTDALQAGGWVWRGVSVWHKPGARPQQGRPVADCEFIVWGTAGPRPQGRAKGEPVGPRLFSGKAPSGASRIHQTQKPVELLAQWVDLLCPADGVVLDPFAGSGSTGEAAIACGRRFIGIELHPHYADVMRTRLSQIGG